MKKDKQINVNVSKAQKYRWVEFQKESNLVGSLAELVRQSVELYIDTDGGRKISNGENGPGEKPGFEDAKLQRVQNQLDELERTVHVIKRQIESDAVDKSLQREIYTALPTESERKHGVRGRTAEYISGVVGSDPIDVEIALESLVDATPAVRRQATDASGETETRYWRRP